MKKDKKAISIRTWFAFATVLFCFAANGGTAESRTYVGVVKASERIAVTARVTGTIWRQCFEEGAQVAKGDVLFELEDVIYKANVESAKAAVEELEAKLKFAGSEVERYKLCLERKSVSKSDCDRAVQERDVTAAQLKAARARLALAENDLKYTRILSPEDGVIGETKIRAGNNVSPDTGTLVEIVRTDPIRIKVAIAERIYFRLFEGGKPRKGISFSVARADGKILDDRPVAVDFADNQVDPKTDTIMVQLSCPNKDRALIPGGFVKVTFHER